MRCLQPAYMHVTAMLMCHAPEKCPSRMRCAELLAVPPSISFHRSVSHAPSWPTAAALPPK